MEKVKNYDKVVEIAGKHLGKVGGDGYSDQYNKDLLVKVPRYLNREGYGLTDKDFVGVDTWNCYEVSAITTKGQPVAGMLKIVCPSNSSHHVESKSIKLYLNSLNMTKIGDNAVECILEIEARVKTVLRNFEPRIKVIAVTVVAKIDRNEFAVTIGFRMTGDTRTTLVPLTLKRLR